LIRLKKEVEVLLMDAGLETNESQVEKGKNGREIFTKELADEIVSACGSGFTLEKAGALVGVNPSTIKTWASRKPDFARRVESARKKHELSLLRDIELAGAKSWQAKAWMAERIYNHAQPSARLQVTQEHTHGISGNLAQLLAGIRGRKQSQVIDAEVVKPKALPTIRDNSYCATDSVQPIVTTTPKVLGKTRHRRMRLRKPRAESLAKYPTTTPPATPPAAV
jgi:hypothetical protein